jgi:hypothetical protein
MAIPHFDFAVPEGYRWLIERGHVGFEDRTPLEPWYFLKGPFDIQDLWPRGPSKAALFGFARRQDTDDIACFEVEGGKVVRIVGIHGWTSEGYVVTETYENIWEWLKSAIDDIAFLTDLEP